MSAAVFDPLLSLSDARLHPGADMPLLEKLGITLPSDHRAALYESNGAEVYGGYVRLFGVATDKSIDAARWNEPEFWKFAWQGRCSNYWCFAETAWGDQYAYDINALSGGDAQVYLLDGLSMTPTLVASSFSEFLEKEFFRSAKEPYDVMLIQARQALGDLEIGTHLVYAPSILLGGTEDVAHVQKMDARAAMICNGDIATQLDAGPPEGEVKGITPYEDADQRMRLQLVWA